MEKKITNYVVTFTQADGHWTAHVEGPQGDLPPYVTPHGRRFPGGYLTLTGCMDSVKATVLDHYAALTATRH